MSLPKRLFFIALALAWPLFAGAQPASPSEEPRVLRVVGDGNYPPFLFRNPEGRATGYVADWWKLWSQKTGVRVELTATNWAEAQHLILRGDADVIDNIFRTPERERLYEFTAPYAAVPVALYVHESIDGIDSVSGLRGFEVGVMEGDACIETLRQKGIRTLRTYPDYTALIRGALAEDIKMFCLDEYPANYYLYRQNAQKVYRMAFPLYEGQFRRAVRKGDQATLRLVEQGARAIDVGTETALRKKWVHPLSQEDHTFARYAGLVLGVVAIIALVLLAWVLSMRAAVRRRPAELQETQRALKERIKEQMCLYSVCRVSEDLSKPLPDILREVSSRLPAGWLHPQLAVARIGYDDQVYATADLGADMAQMSADIRVDGVTCGSVSIAYRETLPLEDEGPFLKEERILIKAVAERLGSVIQRREVEDRLHDSEERFRKLFEDTHQPVLLIEDGRFIAANDAALTVLRAHAPEEVVGRSPMDLSQEFQPDGRASVKKAAEMLDTAFREGNTHFEWEHVRTNGEPFIADVTLTAIRQGNRNLLHVVWNDITAQKKAELELADYRRGLERLVDERTAELTAMTESLQTANEEQQALFEAATAGIVFVRDRRIVRCNDALEHLFGYAHGELVGQSTRVWYPDEETFTQVGRRIAAAQTGDGYFAEDMEMVRKDGSRFWAHVRARAIDPQDLSQGTAGLIEDITEERNAREALLHSHQQQQAILDAASAGIMLIRHRVLEQCNRRLEELTGYSPGELIGQPTRILYADQAAWAAAGTTIYTQIAEGKTYSQEQLARRKDGSTFWVNLSARAIDPADVSKGIVGVLEDITVQRAAVEAIKLANAEQQAILDSASSGIVLLRNRIAIRCNQRMSEILGWPAGGLIGQSTRVWYVDDEMFEVAGQEAYAQIARGETHRREQLMMRRDGTPVWTRMAGHAVDVDDPAKGSVWVIDDITAERAVAEALQRANDEQQAIFNSASSGITLIRDRILVRCNGRLHEIFGWPPGEMVGKPTAIWYPDEAGNITGGEVYDAIWRGEAHRREQELMRKDGSRFWARLTGNAVDVNDRSKGTVWVIDDITLERDATEKMNKARALAEEAARIKGDFLANMSHEIRTPMNAIIGMTHLALRADPSPRQHDYLKKIERSSQHLLGIINDILDFSKIESAKMEIERIDFDLEKVLENVANLIGESASAKGLELILDIDGDVPTHLVGDPLRLGQVLVNFSSNAVKFTERGEVTVHVHVQAQQGDETTLCFEIRDTGIGIDPDLRGRLFQSFHQADTSTTRKYGGTGLGLSISKRLAELMGGEVGVESTPGVGSTFWFTSRLRVNREKSVRPFPDPDLRRRRVLLVDDNDHARKVLAETLRSMTFVVTTAASGQAAIAEIQRASQTGKPYEIAFIDWQMPGLDGVATASEIGRLGLSPSPRVILIAAHGPDDPAQAAANVGIVEVLRKPVSPSLLFDAAMRALGKKRVPPVGDTPPVPSNLGALAGARLLLVEDNDLNQEVASEFLRDLGLSVEIACDGAVALEKVQSNRYDIVLMDVQMPVMDGLTATREIRKLPGFAELPIVAMTANALAADREACLAAGMNDHIAKPIDPETFTAKLLRWASRPPIMPPAIPACPPPRQPEASAMNVDGIPGLDPAVGLRRALGREDLYVSLLTKFVGGQRDFASRITEALAAGDWAAAERYAHTLKGVAGQIGAEPLQAIAGELEQACHAHQPADEVEALVTESGSQLAALIDAIAPRLPASSEVPAEAADPALLRDVLSRLAALLADDDFGSGQLFGANEVVLRAGLGEHFAEIARAIEDFDFATALARLTEATSSRGVVL